MNSLRRTINNFLCLLVVSFVVTSFSSCSSKCERNGYFAFPNLKIGITNIPANITTNTPTSFLVQVENEKTPQFLCETLNTPSTILKVELLEGLSNPVGGATLFAVPQIKEGDSYSTNIDIQFLRSGTYQLRLTIDADSSIYELNENDNVLYSDFFTVQ
jgi:hypothetical protein